MNAVSLPDVETPADVETAAQDIRADHYLLLGELRLLLEEPSDNEQSQLWLLAVLDRLLARLPREPRGDTVKQRFDQGTPFPPASVQRHWKLNLRRLRDRIVHRMPFQILADEIRVELKLLFDPQRSPSND